MWREKKTGTVNQEKHDPGTCPMIIKKSVPRVRTVKPKEKVKVTASNGKRLTTTCETSGNTMRLCVNLMPVLDAAKEPVEEEEGREEEDNSCKKRPETSSRNEPHVKKPVEQTLDHTGFKQPPSPRFVLPPITQPKPAPDRQKSRTPLPPISTSEQTRTTSSDCSIKSFRGDGSVTGEVADSRPWIDNPLFSKSRSAEFRLPDISLSSLDALLQTVSQKLGRKRRGGDEGPWRRVQSDQLLTTVREQRLRETSVGRQNDRCTDDNRTSANMFVCEAVADSSVCGRRVNRLPPLILTMTKKNRLTSNTPH